MLDVALEAPAALDSRGLWSPWDMLQNYFPLCQVAMELQALLTKAAMLKGTGLNKMTDQENKPFRDLLDALVPTCARYGLSHTSEMAALVRDREDGNTYAELFRTLTHLNDSMGSELKKEAAFRIPPERKDYYERDALFGPEVTDAFPSCEHDIRMAGDCYALGQADACVHHLMLVLERGLNALATKVGVPYQRANWQNIIDKIGAILKAAPKGVERDFYKEANAQFGFLKDAYRNHSEHARDDHYDIHRAKSILDHVSEFMRGLAKGGLAE